ncbi:hypothetical protein HELRODRAFT_164038 [Helobdella robusta]|uniref:Uncharacterized protein n=1 Tax=Helobdella robusta TaxID=6412 RepID=T1EUT1_HELRO|nr:hypothetical protein HELRODRAFT_164038 [Helobdella robusta]ESN94233.1 hypothetical protein HELRODRAFT_164038 [Helobdella robusta]
MKERTSEDSKCKSKAMENTDSEIESAAHLPTFVNVSNALVFQKCAEMSFSLKLGKSHGRGSTGSVMCSICIEAKSSTLASDVTPGCRKDRALIDETLGGKLPKKLLKKIDKHQQSKCYPYPLVVRIFAP